MAARHVTHASTPDASVHSRGASQRHAFLDNLVRRHSSGGSSELGGLGGGRSGRGEGRRSSPQRGDGPGSRTWKDTPPPRGFKGSPHLLAKQESSQRKASGRAEGRPSAGYEAEDDRPSLAVAAVAAEVMAAAEAAGAELAASPGGWQGGDPLEAALEAAEAARQSAEQARQRQVAQAAAEAAAHVASRQAAQAAAVAASAPVQLARAAIRASEQANVHAAAQKEALVKALRAHREKMQAVSPPKPAPPVAAACRSPVATCCGGRTPIPMPPERPGGGAGASATPSGLPSGGGFGSGATTSPPQPGSLQDVQRVAASIRAGLAAAMQRETSETSGGAPARGDPTEPLRVPDPSAPSVRALLQPDADARGALPPAEGAALHSGAHPLQHPTAAVAHMWSDAPAANADQALGRQIAAAALDAPAATTDQALGRQLAAAALASAATPASLTPELVEMPSWAELDDRSTGSAAKDGDESLVAKGLAEPFRSSSSSTARAAGTAGEAEGGVAVGGDALDGGGSFGLQSSFGSEAPLGALARAYAPVGSAGSEWILTRARLDSGPSLGLASEAGSEAPPGAAAEWLSFEGFCELMRTRYAGGFPSHALAHHALLERFDELDHDGERRVSATQAGRFAVLDALSHSARRLIELLQQGGGGDATVDPIVRATDLRRGAHELGIQATPAEIDALHEALLAAQQQQQPSSSLSMEDASADEALADAASGGASSAAAPSAAASAASPAAPSPAASSPLSHAALALALRPSALPAVKAHLRAATAVFSLARARGDERFLLEHSMMRRTSNASLRSLSEQDEEVGGGALGGVPWDGPETFGGEGEGEGEEAFDPALQAAHKSAQQVQATEMAEAHEALEAGLAAAHQALARSQQLLATTTDDDRAPMADGVTADGATADGVTADGVTADGVTADGAAVEIAAEIASLSPEVTAALDAQARTQPRGNTEDSAEPSAAETADEAARDDASAAIGSEAVAQASAAIAAAAARAEAATKEAAAATYAAMYTMQEAAAATEADAVHSVSSRGGRSSSPTNSMSSTRSGKHSTLNLEDQRRLQREEHRRLFELEKASATEKAKKDRKRQKRLHQQRLQQQLLQQQEEAARAQQQQEAARPATETEKDAATPMRTQEPSRSPPGPPPSTPMGGLSPITRLPAAPPSTPADESIPVTPAGTSAEGAEGSSEAPTWQGWIRAKAATYALGTRSSGGADPSSTSA